MLALVATALLHASSTNIINGLNIINAVLLRNNEKTRMQRQTPQRNKQAIERKIQITAQLKSFGMAQDVNIFSIFFEVRTAGCS